jgi:hypothetical protein
LDATLAASSLPEGPRETLGQAVNQWSYRASPVASAVLSQRSPRFVIAYRVQTKSYVVLGSSTFLFISARKSKSRQRRLLLYQNSHDRWFSNFDFQTILES